ncbi:nuclear transport factor 2 family protein [Pseudonocardia lacus]|uniref:nuclear transport factor 2 family protein n=1 Tax=Pseudonocardia lacus TaxID=2835865 RepID=UPI001BDCB3F2|nr:nuclear transport factor 2 family protein [Pseudonocardia lacus]
MPTAPVPADDFAGYLRAYTAEVTSGDDDPAAVVDRYHAPDIQWVSDGTALDRDRLVAHVRPARHNARSVRVDVHDVVVSGDRVAARYTLRATLRKGRELAMDAQLFGTLAADGRLRRVDQITRTLPG